MGFYRVPAQELTGPDTKLKAEAAEVAMKRVPPETAKPLQTH